VCCREFLVCIGASPESSRYLRTYVEMAATTKHFRSTGEAALNRLYRPMSAEIDAGTHSRYMKRE
jgi:hypothetical protein